MLLWKLLELFRGAGALESRDSKWSHCRLEWLKDHPTCEACGGTEAVQVHHKQPVQYFPERELDRTNFQTLCEQPARNCHLNIGHSGCWDCYNPHSVEDAALLLKRRRERRCSKS